MTTPGDVARMMARAASSSGNYTQNGPLPEGAENGLEPVPLRPLYSSETPQYGQRATLRLPEGDVEFSEDRIDSREVEDSPIPPRPTPAIMAKKQTQPTTFASLDARELPVVREYSAGGLIFDEQGRVAIIARHSRSGHLEWCLPKGHIEKGETPEQTAVREVHEETGILGEVITSIATIDYWFTGTAQRVHKLVHHYALRMIGGELTVEGDPDHEAEDAIWVRFDDLNDVLSYPNERRIAWLYARKHRK
ncbi:MULTISPECIES: NUDIX hydrolase [Bifidobacterium]|uniref:NUDIX hydrolase n=1 Tax=Bifidobacterium TaxID=1678 RepID=UPI001783B88A|nr:MULTISPECIES: NUDIX hydrolase [Bifidobacterium]